MATFTRITPCLWFDTQGEDAATLYTSVFENSRILQTTHYGSAGPRPEGMVMTVLFELDGQQLLALNGGPELTFDEAKAQRAISAMLRMKKLDIGELERAASSA